jgi:hypothetical protein
MINVNYYYLLGFILKKDFRWQTSFQFREYDLVLRLKSGETATDTASTNNQTYKLCTLMHTEFITQTTDYFRSQLQSPTTSLYRFEYSES